VSTQRRLRSSDRPYRFNPVTKLPLCRWCEADVQPPKLTFCSAECVHEFKLRSDPRYMRTRVFERDRGVCSECKLDTMALQRELSEFPYGAERDAQKIALGFPPHRDTYWDADHVQPVSEGGGLCGLDNLRTLCIRCHTARRRKAA
jgi:5-methylcytosine-specific restriction protein A